MNKLGVKQINETRMVLRHHKNMGRFAEKFFCEALAAEFPKIEPITGDGIDRVAAGWLALPGADSSGFDMDVFAGFFGYMTKKNLRHRASTDIPCANK